MSASAVIHQTWINRRPWPCYRSSLALSTSLLFALRFFSLHISLLFRFSSQSCCLPLDVYRVHLYCRRYFRCQGFPSLSRQTTRVVAQIIVIRNNVIMFARDSSRDYPGNRMLSEWNWAYYFPRSHPFVFRERFSVRWPPSILVLSSTIKDKIMDGI